MGAVNGHSETCSLFLTSKRFQFDSHMTISTSVFYSYVASAFPYNKQSPRQDIAEPDLIDEFAVVEVELAHDDLFGSVCVCVCVCARARVCMRV